jgi:hypothetical protein
MIRVLYRILFAFVKGNPVLWGPEDPLDVMPSAEGAKLLSPGAQALGYRGQEWEAP